jgi:hypothetical protein
MTEASNSSSQKNATLLKKFKDNFLEFGKMVAVIVSVISLATGAWSLVRQANQSESERRDRQQEALVYDVLFSKGADGFSLKEISDAYNAKVATNSDDVNALGRKAITSSELNRVMFSLIEKKVANLDSDGKFTVISIFRVKNDFMDRQKIIQPIQDKILTNIVDGYVYSNARDLIDNVVRETKTDQKYVYEAWLRAQTLAYTDVNGRICGIHRLERKELPVPPGAPAGWNPIITINCPKS